MTAEVSFWDQFEDTPGPYSTSQPKNPQMEKQESSSFNWDSFEDAPENPWYQSFASAAAKGVIKGVIGLGENFGPLLQSPQQKLKEKGEREESLEQILPSEKGTTEALLERGGEILPAVVSGPGGIVSKLIRTGLAAASGEAAKELGFGETGQAIAELPALIGPGLKGKISPTKAQQPIVEEARRLGLTEKEIAPLIQSEKKQSILKKFASRGDKTQEILKGSKAAVDNLYQTIGASPAAKNVISNEVKNKLAINFKKQFEQMPEELKKKIAPDVKDLIRGEITGEKLINFWQDVNHYIKKGDGKLGLLKQPILEAMQGVSAEFAKDFQVANQLYAKSAKIRRSLSPKDENIVSKFIDATAPYQLIGAVVSGYYPAMVTVVGEIGARKLASAMLLNPRYQNLAKQITHATAENNVQLALNLKKILQDEMQEETPEAAAILDYFNPKAKF